MKLRKLPISNDNVILLGALGLIAYNSFPHLSVQKEQIDSVFELSEDGEPIIPAKSSTNNYIQKAKVLMSMNDYGVIKTLYKLQSVLDDISLYSAPDIVSDTSPQSDILEVLYSVEPYLSDSKKDKFHSISNNIDKTKTTIDNLRRVKAKVNDVPEGTKKIEKIKVLINELPNLSGIPLLENLGNIKDLTSLLKPLSEITQNISKEPKSEDEEYNEIYDLVNLIDHKKNE